MNRRARLLTGLAISGWLLSFASCASPPTAAQMEEDHRERLAREVDDELMVGREIASRLLGRFGYYDKSKKALEYVNLVGTTLAAQSGRPELRFHFAILNSDDSNAFACPGGFVFITKGLLKQLKTESELAGVLGHEIAHVNEKHMYNAVVPKREVSTTETFARLLSRGKSEIGGNLAKIIESGMKMLLEDGYGKEKEYAADQAGAFYAKSSNYDPTATLQVLNDLKVAQKTSKFSKTHPPFDERIQAFRKFLAENGLSSAQALNQSGVLAARFDEALRKEPL